MWKGGRNIRSSVYKLFSINCTVKNFTDNFVIDLSTLQADKAFLFSLYCHGGKPLLFSFLINSNRQLDNVSRSVFKENVRLNEALGYHLKEVEELKRSNKALTEENASLILDKVWKSQRSASGTTPLYKPALFSTVLLKHAILNSNI